MSSTPVPIIPTLALRPKEAAAAIGISERALWTLTRDETSGLPHLKIGTATLYPTADLVRWLSERAAQTKKT